MDTSAKTVDVLPIPGPIWHIAHGNGHRIGPFTEEEVRGMIKRQELKVTDSVITDGGTTWVPITQSPFREFIVGQAAVDRLATSTCPRCGAGMIVTRKVPKMAFFFIAVGIFTAVAVIGIIFLVIGWTMRRNAKMVYVCPRCQYSA